MYGTKPGLYLLAGPDWKGTAPIGIVKVFHSSTNIGVVIPRAFMNDTPEDRQAIQSVISGIGIYPLSKFTGQAQTTDWSKLPSFPNMSKGEEETKWVQPETYFDQLPAVMKEVPPLPGEEALYANIQNVLDAASKDPKLHAALAASAVEADKNLVDPLFQFHNYGIPLPNNWTTQTNGASVAGCYIDLDARIWFSQTITQCALAWFRRYPARVPSIWGFVDSDGTPLSGGSNYHLHLPPKIPAANFWSLTAYEAENASGLASSQAFPSLGLRDKPAQNPDGSMELYIGPKAPAGKESNWLATVPGRGYFTIFRLYGPTETAIDKSWKPGDLEKDK